MCSSMVEPLTFNQLTKVRFLSHPPPIISKDMGAFDAQTAEFDPADRVWEPTGDKELDQAYLLLREKLQTLKKGYPRIMALRFLQASRFWIKIIMDK